MHKTRPVTIPLEEIFLQDFEVCKYENELQLNFMISVFFFCI